MRFPMIRIILIGINHFDPFGPQKVRLALELASSKGFIPDGIAVEWSKRNAAAVIAQRDAFGRSLLHHFPMITSGDLDAIKHSLAFEADAHLDMYPDLPVIWLDEDRVANPSIIERYADDRVSIIRSAADGNDFSLARISYTIIHNADVTPMPSERDKKFTSVIDVAVSSGHHSIACIVGQNHAEFAVKGMFGYELLHKGYPVIRYITTADRPVWEDLSYMSI